MTGPDPAVAAVRRAVRRSIADLRDQPHEQLALVALSGGADSTALAAASAFEVRTGPLRVGAVVVDHGLQEDSAAVAQEAAAAARDMGLDPVRVVRVDVGGPGGPEAAARRARYLALHDEARRHGAVTVLLGHTRDDQAETVLLGLGRGSGARSIAGMRPVDGLWRRPLLDVTRAQTTAACAAQQLTVWNDPHNDDAGFTRVRLRREVMPALTDALGPGVVAALARTADRLRDDDDALSGWAERVAHDARCDDGGWSVDVLADVPHAVRSRVMRQIALDAGVLGGSLTSEHVAAVGALVTAWHGQGPANLPGGVVAQRRCGRLYLAAVPQDGSG